MVVLAVNQTLHAHFPLRESRVVAAAHGEGELAHQALLEFMIGAGKLDRADSFVGGGDQHAA